MIETTFHEKAPDTLKLDFIDKITCERMLIYIYKGNVQIPEEIYELFALLDASEHFDLSGLKSAVLLKGKHTFLTTGILCPFIPFIVVFIGRIFLMIYKHSVKFQ